MNKLEPLRVAVIGCGYWGPNYCRILEDLPNASLVGCCDLEQKNLDRVLQHYPGVYACKDYKQLLSDTEFDAAIVTVPLTAHFEVTRDCLKKGKHVLVEKPFVAKSSQARQLQTLAKRVDRVLMVGHVYRFHPAVLALKQYVAGKKLGDIYYVFAERLGLGPIRKYASALWDLATHDISIALYLTGEMPVRVTASGEYYLQKGVKDLVFVSLEFPSRVVYNIYASWLAPEKIRKTTIVGSKGMVVFDDVNKTETLKFFDRRIDVGLLHSTPQYSDHQLVVNIGDVSIPAVEQSEPLKNQVSHFIASIRGHSHPASDSADGLNVVKILEAAERSLKERKTIVCR